MLISQRGASINDGCQPELVAGARFDGELEIPFIEPPTNSVIPNGFTPFTKRRRSPTDCEALSFFEPDRRFANYLINPMRYWEQIRQFSIFVPPDCSVYRRAPLAVQIANIYRSRAIGYAMQRAGANVYPLIRWGDERTYTVVHGEKPISFLGVEEGSIVVVSTYGCIRGQENERHFRNGVTSMLQIIKPKIVLVHGSMPSKVFGNLLGSAEFHAFPNWISRMKGGK